MGFTRSQQNMKQSNIPEQEAGGRACNRAGSGTIPGTARRVWGRSPGAGDHLSPALALLSP